jgi:hypothetical protein
VLVYWRNRLRASPRPRRIFEAVRQVVEQTGVLTGRGRRVLDSTILADAVATQDTVTQLVAAIRRVRRLVPHARQVRLGAHDYDRPGKPDCAWDDPQATQALVSGLVNDALAVLAAVADLELGDEQAEAVAWLALVGSCTAVWPIGSPTRSRSPGPPPNRRSELRSRAGGATPRRTGHLDHPGAGVQLGQGCREVKRDGTAGLVGCWIRRPPKAAPPSRRVRPRALIALDRGHGIRREESRLASAGRKAQAAFPGRQGLLGDRLELP